MARYLQPCLLPRCLRLVGMRRSAICVRKRPGTTLHFAPVAGPRTISTITVPAFEPIDPSILVEEEALPGYKDKHYYPVHLGETFTQRFTTIGKLGFGSASTVWLCRDSRKNSYVVLKVYINCSKVHRELPIYEHISSLPSEHRGRNNVRKLLEHFEVVGPHGTHKCLVHQPMSVSLDEIKEISPGSVFPVEILRVALRQILDGLEFLHQEARVIHTDLQPRNLLMGIQDDSVLASFERCALEMPYPTKEPADRTMYMSRRMPSSFGPTAISDLSEARFGESKHTDDIMPSRYRAPEVILSLPWSYPVDIWALAMVIWDLFEDKPLLPPQNPGGQYSGRYHLAQMIAIMGNWIAEVPIPETSLETAETRLEGQEKRHFLVFMRKMLQWRPEDRGDCKDIFWDEWLLADMIEDGIVMHTPD